MSIISGSQHTWISAGQPSHPYRVEPAPDNGICATCATMIADGIPLTEIETPTTANHSEFFRHGGSHVCHACAWLFAAGKGRPGNYIASSAGGIEYAVISLESVVADKRPWIHILREIATLDHDAIVSGVMTTDVKPRLWPRARLATVGHFGLYIHAGDY